MNRRIPKSLTVDVDDREKYPILFPRSMKYFDKFRKPHLIQLIIRKQRLRFGDYRLACDPRGCVVERKGSVSELANNLLTKDRPRTLRALHRLVKECRTPVLVLDIRLSDFFLNPRTPHQPPPSITICELFRVLQDLGIHLFIPGACKGTIIRRCLGEALVHLMLEDFLNA